GASVQATDGPAGVAGLALLRRQPVAIGGEARAGRAKGVGRPVAAESVARGRAARPRAVGLTAAGPRVAPGAGPTLAIPGEAGAGAGRPAVGAREARVEAIAALRVARIARGAIRGVRAAGGIGGRARRGGTAGHARRGAAGVIVIVARVVFAAACHCRQHRCREQPPAQPSQAYRRIEFHWLPPSRYVHGYTKSTRVRYVPSAMTPLGNMGQWLPTCG